MFDLVRSADGSVAPTLSKFAASHARTNNITAAIDQFWDDVDTFEAVIWDPDMNNLLVTGSRKAGYKLVLVDGLGSRTFIPLQSVSHTYRKNAVSNARAKMKRAYDTIAPSTMSEHLA